ncbi:MAG: hypothetical protein WCV59_04260 [Parcubacteria group bacterium]|jgi:hypothetical protein
MTKKLFKIAFLCALGEVVYIILVATFFRNAEKYLSQKPDTIFAPITLLLLLVLSAAVSGALILGKPATLYFDGQKKEAVKLFILTLGCLLLFLIIALAILFISK